MGPKPIPKVSESLMPRLGLTSMVSIEASVLMKRPEKLSGFSHSVLSPKGALIARPKFHLGLIGRTR